MIRVHGTAIALRGGGILLRGPSGAGKSDLALRLIDQGARLVADDQTELQREESCIVMRAPPPTAGQIEIRGFGIIPVPAVSSAPLQLVADLVPADRIERMPEPRSCHYLGCAIPLIALAPFEASAVAKLRFALHHFAALGAAGPVAALP